MQTQNFIIKTTEIFENWLKALKDPIAKYKILQRIERAQSGNFGDHKPLKNAENISEMRVDTGKGYRIYYANRNGIIYILLNGGNKTTQTKDIEKAKEILKTLEDEENGD